MKSLNLIVFINVSWGLVLLGCAAACDSSNQRAPNLTKEFSRALYSSDDKEREYIISFARWHEAELYHHVLDTNADAKTKIEQVRTRFERLDKASQGRINYAYLKFMGDMSP